MFEAAKVVRVGACRQLKLAANLTCTEIVYPTRCRPLRLIHSIFLCNFRMKPEPPEIAQVRRNLTNLRAPAGDILEGSPPTWRTNGEAHAGQSRQTENRSDR
jgi:hypothetical protein